MKGSNLTVGELAPAYKHGHGYESPTYRSWKAMRVRCGWRKGKDYPNYGGRGIVVCDRWKAFKNFLEDMGERPVGLTLERRDNDGPYCKDNCEWADRTMQNNNTRQNRIVGGMTMAQAARAAGMPYETLRNRLNRGWEQSEALTRPLRVW